MVEQLGFVFVVGGFWRAKERWRLRHARWLRGSVFFFLLSFNHGFTILSNATQVRVWKLFYRSRRKDTEPVRWVILDPLLIMQGYTVIHSSRQFDWYFCCEFCNEFRAVKDLIFSFYESANYRVSGDVQFVNFNAHSF
jgi:4-amino-4-deoxy-L-arabinose transferase-like glycosyltransferase